MERFIKIISELASQIISADIKGADTLIFFGVCVGAFAALWVKVGPSYVLLIVIFIIIAWVANKLLTVYLTGSLLTRTDSSDDGKTVLSDKKEKNQKK